MNQQEILATLREYKRTNADKYGILELGVFGSVARNEAGEDSDVDVIMLPGNRLEGRHRVS